MNKPTQRIEFLLNIAIIFVAIAICVVLARHYFLTKPVSLTGQPAIGSKLELPGVDLSSGEKTLLLVLQKGCHFCTESGPFYQRLARETSRDGRVRVVAVLPQDPGEGRQYLSDLGVPVSNVTQASLDSLGVKGTPTLIMVSHGTVSDVWVGKLPAEGEAEVLSKL